MPALSDCACTPLHTTPPTPQRHARPRTAAPRATPHGTKLLFIQRNQMCADTAPITSPTPSPTPNAGTAAHQRHALPRQPRRVAARHAAPRHTTPFHAMARHSIAGHARYKRLEQDCDGTDLNQNSSSYLDGITFSQCAILCDQHIDCGGIAWWEYEVGTELSHFCFLKRTCNGALCADPTQCTGNGYLRSGSYRQAFTTLHFCTLHLCTPRHATPSHPTPCHAARADIPNAPYSKWTLPALVVQSAFPQTIWAMQACLHAISFTVATICTLACAWNTTESIVQAAVIV